MVSSLLELLLVSGCGSSSVVGRGRRKLPRCEGALLGRLRRPSVVGSVGCGVVALPGEGGDDRDRDELGVV